MVYTIELAAAPLGLALNNQFRRPTVKGRIAFSDAYPYMKISIFIHRIFLSLSFAKDSINQSIFQ